MITANVIQRTFHLKTSDSSFTGFTIDVKGRQYLCTAKHCLPDIQLDVPQCLEIFHDEVWKRLKVHLVGFGSENVDICVLALEQRLSPLLQLTAAADGIIYGQDVYYLGFPYGMGFSEKINSGFPFPFVKRATLSAFPSAKQKILYLDGHNNPGFSGGPVVFRKNGDQRENFLVAAVISGYKTEAAPVFAGSKDDAIPIITGDDARKMQVQLNTGIVISFCIYHAIDAINRNPIGFKVE